VLVAVGALIAGAGIGLVRRWAPALVATAFLIPIDPFGRYRIAEPLQNVTAAATQWVCDLLGIYVDRFGASLTINGVDVTVAEACNGMRMVMTLFMVCYVVVFTLPLRSWARVMFLALSPVVAVAANVIRLVPTVWMFGHKSAEAAERFHVVSGWAMTIVACLLLLGMFGLLRWAGVPVARPAPVK
jgi:exosortase